LPKFWEKITKILKPQNSKDTGIKKEDSFSILLGAIFHHVSTILKFFGKLFLPIVRDDG
jgi:hypothetical protein